MLSLLLLGCRVAVGENRPASADNAADSARQASTDETVSLRNADWAGVQKFVERQRGKVVAVNVWTTTCDACIKKFPEFVALQSRYGHEDVACISVNCDYDGIEGKPPEYYRKRVLEFLAKHDATFDNVLLSVPFLEFLQKTDLASTPAVFVYDRSGRLVKRFDNDDAVTADDEFTVEEINRLIGRLVASD